MGVIPLTSILSHKGRGGHFHPSVALHRSMITQDKLREAIRVTKIATSLTLPAMTFSPTL